VPPVLPVPLPNWTGCYVGGNIGGAWSNVDLSGVSGVNFSASNGGVAGGGQIGCDYQWGAWVAGIRNMLDATSLSSTRQIIRDMLASTDYEITEAENGEQALAAIAKQRPDLILMDIQLPIVDGYTATRQIKSDPALRSIPIIAVTSYALREEENKARAAGCDDYVPKPFSPRQLLAKIRYYLQ
jgi:two-component system, cell cycle response regulator DivK